MSRMTRAWDFYSNRKGWKQRRRIQRNVNKCRRCINTWECFAIHFILRYRLAIFIILTKRVPENTTLLNPFVIITVWSEGSPTLYLLFLQRVDMHPAKSWRLKAIYIYVCLFVCLSVCPYFCLAVCPSVRLYVCLSVCLSFCLPYSLPAYQCGQQSE